LSTATILAATALPALAQFRVEVSGIGLTQLPIALPAFKGEAQAPQKISAIVKADLERSGMFRSVDASGMQADETTQLDATAWRQRGADSVATGSVTALADGRFDVRVRLWDVVRSQDLGGQSHVVSGQSDRSNAANCLSRTESAAHGNIVVPPTNNNPLSVCFNAQQSQNCQSH